MYYIECDLKCDSVNYKGFQQVPKDFFKGVVECLQEVTDVVVSKWIKLPEGEGKRYYALNSNGEYHIFGYSTRP